MPDTATAHMISGDDIEIVVYNQRFVEETFYQADDSFRDFYLSKGNKDARTAIDQATKELVNWKLMSAISKPLNVANVATSSALEDAKAEIWDIKTRYSGGDRVLDFCLDGYKGSSDKLFATSAPTRNQEQPPRTIQEIETETKSITAGDATRLSSLRSYSLTHTLLRVSLFLGAIIGSEFRGRRRNQPAW